MYITFEERDQIMADARVVINIALYKKRYIALLMMA